MSYKRPILTEIYASLYLQPGTLPSAQIANVVPVLQRQGFSEIESAMFDVEVNSSAGEVVRSKHNVTRCWSQDHTRLVQLAIDHVVMNLVTPDGKYPGWDTFLNTVVEPTMSSLTESLPTWRPESLALNTIDRASIALSGFRLGDYLNCGGPRIPAILADTSVAFDYDIGRGLLQVDGRNRQLHISGRIVDGSYDLHTVAVLHDRIESDRDIRPTLERLHDESNSWFESMINDRLRNEVMGGEVNASSGS